MKELISHIPVKIPGLFILLHPQTTHSLSQVYFIKSLALPPSTFLKSLLSQREQLSLLREQSMTHGPKLQSKIE
jgi:hypothetical protein